MFLYVIAIILSLIIVYCADYFATTSRIVCWILSIISLLPATILAGVRDFTVGADITSYIVPNFYVANGTNNLTVFLDYLSFLHVTTGGVDYSNGVHYTEVGFSCLVWFISRLTSDAHWLLFTVQLLISIFVLLAARKAMRMFNIPLFWTFFIYYTGFYIYGLNLMRQYISAAILLFAILFLLEEKYFKFIALVFMSYTFHSMGLLGFACLAIFIFLKLLKKYKPNYKMYVLLSLILFSLVYIGGTRFFNLIYQIASHIPLFSNHLSSFNYANERYIPLRRLLVFLIFPVSYLLILARGQRKGRISGDEDRSIDTVAFRMVAILSLLSIPFSLIGTVSSVLYRVGLSLDFFLIIGLPSTNKYFKNRNTFKVCMLLSGVVTLGYIFYSQYADTIPYNSQILSSFFGI